MASNAEHVSIWWRHYDLWHERYKSICFIPIDLHKVFDIFKRVHWRLWPSPGARPTIGIPIEFEIQWNFAMLLFITYAVDHNEILHTIVTLSLPRWWQLINNVNICFYVSQENSAQDGLAITLQRVWRGFFSRKNRASRKALYIKTLPYKECLFDK